VICCKALFIVSVLAVLIVDTAVAISLLNQLSSGCIAAGTVVGSLAVIESVIIARSISILLSSVAPAPAPW